ncbi:hypothetical protein ACWKWP_07585 [Agromyces soli]
MNTTTLTTHDRRTDVRTGAQLLRERLAARLGHALLEWSRRHDERRTSDAVATARLIESHGTELRDREFARVALSVAAR